MLRRLIDHLTGKSKRVEQVDRVTTAQRSLDDAKREAKYQIDRAELALAQAKEQQARVVESARRDLTAAIREQAVYLHVSMRDGVSTEALATEMQRVMRFTRHGRV